MSEQEYEEYLNAQDELEELYTPSKEEPWWNR